MHRRLKDVDGLQAYRKQLTNLLKQGVEGGRVCKAAL